MSATVLLVADAGPEDGLGHLSRLSAIAVALHCRGIETHCHANAAPGPLERDGVAWAPWSPGDPLPSDVGLVIIDSYRIEPEEVLGAGVPFVTFDDDRDVRAAPSLVVSVAAPPSDLPPRLSGPRYAALRPAYWGLPPRVIVDPIRRVLVTTGGGDSSATGAEIARAVADQLPDANVLLVRGPHAPAFPADGIRVIDAPDTLSAQQLAADLVICGGGQTMLETAACGTPCLTLVLAENQRNQAVALASSDAVVLVDTAADATVAALCELDVVARRDLSRCAQQAVDGHGAHRIAFHVGALLDGSAASAP